MSLCTTLTTSRRQTMGLALLSLAGLTSATAEVKGNRRKHRKKNDTCDRKAEHAVSEACGSQTAFCMANGEALCEREADVSACPASIGECCAYFGQCDPASYYTCLKGRFGPPDSV